MKKQKLQLKLKNVPTDAPQVCSSTSMALNKDQSLSVPSKVLDCNNPEVAQSQRTAKLKVVVYVLSIDGKPLMPCRPAKAKKLLNNGKAEVVRRFPFTIKLNFECENQVQEISLGIDAGYANIGFSAVTEKKEVASGTLKLDGKTSERLTTRAMHRKHRRSRHHWYRKPRFLNRKIEQGWLAPSIQRRYDTHLRLINLLQKLIPITKTTIETANFDIQKLINPDISGTEYQQGNLYGYENLKSFVIAREHGKCQLCQKEKGKQKWNLHHKDERCENGTDRPENFALLHEKCHIKLHKKGLKFSKPKQYKAETFMSTVQHKFLADIPNVEITFGYKTFRERVNLCLEKTHFNDAFVIASGKFQERISPIEIFQKHKNGRTLQLNRKGFRPSIRRQRYKIQPKDLIWIEDKKYVSAGIQNKGEQIRIENSKKVFPTKKIEKIYNFGSIYFKK